MSKGKWKNNPRANDPNYYYDEKSKQYRKKSQKMKDKENGIEHSSKYADNPDYYFDEKRKQYRKKTNGRKKSKYADNPDYYYDETKKRYKKIRKQSKYADNLDYYYDEKSKQYRKKTNGRKPSKYAGNPDYYYDENTKKYKKIRKTSKYADNPDYYYDEKRKRYRKKPNGRKQSRFANDPNYYKDETTGKWTLKCIKYTRDNPVLIFWNGVDFSDFTVCDDKLLSGPTTFNCIEDFIANYHQKYGPIKGRNVYVSNPQKFLKTLCRYSKKDWSKSLTNPNYKSHIMININHVSETYYEINTLLTKNTDIFYDCTKSDEEAYNALYSYAKYILSLCHTGCTTAKVAHNLKMIDTNPTKNTPELLKARCGSIMPRWDIKGLPKDLNDTLRPAFYGGINYVNYDDIGKELKNLTYLDRNSAYPYIDANSPLPVELPVGKKVEETLTPEDCMTYLKYEYNLDRTLSIVKCTLVLDHIKPNHLYNDPFHLFNSDRLTTRFNDVLVIYDMLFTTVDLYNLAVLYKGCLQQVEINYKWTFRTRRGIYRNFVQKHYEKRQQLKKELENLYAEQKYDEALQTNIKLTAEKSLLNFSTGKDAEKFSGGSTEYNGKFLPIAIFRTAWQRFALCKIINYLGEHFKYGDTDSAIVDEIGMKMLNDLKASQKILSLGTELGQWKCVDKIDKFRVLGHKLYGYVADTKEKIVIAGFSTSLLRKVVHYNNFNYKLRVDMDTVKEYGSLEDIAKFTQMCFTSDDIYYTDKSFSLIQKERFTPSQKELLKIYA